MTLNPTDLIAYIVHMSHGGHHLSMLRSLFNEISSSLPSSLSSPESDRLDGRTIHWQYGG